MSKKKWKVVFDREGNLVPVVYGNWSMDDDGSLEKEYLARGYKLEDPESQFMASLTIHRAKIGTTGSPNVCWVDSVTNAKYYQTFKAFFATIKRCSMRQGTISGVWGYEKNGKMQSIVLIQEVPV